MTKTERDLKVAKILLLYGKPKLYKMNHQWWASTKGTCGGGDFPAQAYNAWLCAVTRKDRSKWKAIPHDPRFFSPEWCEKFASGRAEGTRVVKLMPVTI